MEHLGHGLYWLLAQDFPSSLVGNVIFAPIVVNFYVCLVC